MRFLQHLFTTSLSIGLFTFANSVALAQSLSLSDQEYKLRLELCAEQWEDALLTLGQIISNPDITSSQRTEFFQQRQQIQEHILFGSSIENLPSCGGAGATINHSQIPEVSPTTPHKVAPPQVQTVHQPIDWQAEATAIQNGRRTIWNNTRVSKPWERSSYTGSGGGGGGGSCDRPDQKDSAGRRCGGRAASERPGGRP